MDKLKLCVSVKCFLLFAVFERSFACFCYLTPSNTLCITRNYGSNDFSKEKNHMPEHPLSTSDDYFPLSRVHTVDCSCLSMLSLILPAALLGPQHFLSLFPAVCRSPIVLCMPELPKMLFSIACSIVVHALSHTHTVVFPNF